MAISKISKFIKTFRGKALLAGSLLLVVLILFISRYVLKNDENPQSVENVTQTGNNIIEGNPQGENNKEAFAKGLDSVLYNFGIKPEWISTPSELKNPKQKVQPAESEWFVKKVIIPSDLSTIEVNADISAFSKTRGLETEASEDIITKDITLQIRKPDSNKTKLPLVKINIEHSDKIKRESAMFCIIINNITEYKNEDIDKLILNKSEFSYVFPRNLDDIDVQNKMLHSKKDILINLLIGAKDNYDADFNITMDEKSIRERVKSFATDFPTVGTVLLSRADPDVAPAFVEAVAAEFGRFNIKVIRDSDLTSMLSGQEEESKEKYSVLGINMKNKAAGSRSFVTMISVDKETFTSFYDEIMRLKKLGYKFYSYSDFASKRAEFEKAEQEKIDKLKEEKLKQEEQKKHNDKKAQDKKQTDKKKQEKIKTTEKKNTTDKKKTDTKKTDTKKTDPKKKTNVKKK